MVYFLGQVANTPMTAMLVCGALGLSLYCVAISGCSVCNVLPGCSMYVKSASG